ncbi:hypothetical protein [Carboxylicivirga marina]|uniref:DUF4625 domain-containing protein n=1 Tax=Carboxylicivirga marina TaxID=2800988 RepID=A0ABS1HI99_9BACT|nr:hypothetical protein [Carboxylicivirga marina]MBK3517215.1 hypothetical protein [Carboxylicivirga marina]
MKYLIALFLVAFLAFGCDDDDDNNDHEYHLENIGVKTVNLPDSFTYGEIYKITGTIELPNSCYYYYNQYDYFYEGTTRIIYPLAHVDDGVSCTTNTSVANFVIPLHVLQEETYTFKFYQGLDDQGEEMFLVIDVPVGDVTVPNN